MEQPGVSKAPQPVTVGRIVMLQVSRETCLPAIVFAVDGKGRPDVEVFGRHPNGNVPHRVWLNVEYDPDGAIETWRWPERVAPK